MTHTPKGDLTSAHRSQRDEPGWTLERPIKDPIRLEVYIGVPFFDFYAGSREGGFEQGIFDFSDADLKPMIESRAVFGEGHPQLHPTGRSPWAWTTFIAERTSDPSHASPNPEP